MDEMMYYNKHYIMVDEQGRITDGWSNGPHPERNTTGAVCINAQGGYQFRLWDGGEENPALYDWDGISLYQWDGEQVIKRTAEEIEADRAALPAGEPAPTTEERLEALETQKADQTDVDELNEALDLLLSGVTE